jgi:predicted permease
MPQHSKAETVIRLSISGRAKSLWYRLFDRDRIDRELDEEIRSHIEILAEQKSREGLSPEDARRGARIEFGSIGQVKEQVQEVRFGAGFEALVRDVHFGVRMLRKNPGFTSVAVATLAIAIGVSTAMFAIVNAWLLRPLPLKNSQELATVWRTRLEAPHQPAFFDLYHDYLFWSANNRTFQSLAAVYQWEYTLTGAGQPEQIHGAVTSWNFFQMTEAGAYLGRVFEEDDIRKAPSCVISYSLWKEHFHSAADVLGLTIELNRKPCVLIGVLPTRFSFRVLDRPFETAVWRVITLNDERYNHDSASPVAVIGRLKSGVTLAQAEGDLSSLQSQLDRQSPEKLVMKDSGVLVANLQEDTTRTIRSSLWLLFAAVGVLLIIACVNVGSLILGRSAKRSNEFAVRIALGCGPSRLLRQLTVESALIFLVGGTLGFALTFALLRFFVAWSPFGVLPPGGLTLDATALAVTALTVLVATLLFGSLPALRTLDIGRSDELRSGPRTTPARAHLYWRSILVGAQIALSVVLLVGAGVLILTFVKIDAEPLGFHTEEAVAADVALPKAVYRTDDDRTRFCQELTRGIANLPGVRSVGCAATWPFNVDGLTPLETDGKEGLPMEQLPRAAIFEVGPGYFDALGIPLLRGRAFSESDSAGSTPRAIINQEMASEYFGGGDPIGKHVKLRYSDQLSAAEPWLTVVGVVGDTRSVRYNHIEWDRYPAVYTSFFQHFGEFPVDLADTRTMYVYVRASSIDASEITSVIHSIDANLALGSLQKVSQIVRDLHSQPRVRAVLIGSFGLWALLLAGVGVGGVMGQTVEHRRHDIGVRMALGAQRREVLSLILGQALRLALAGSAIGLVAAWAATRLISEIFYGVSTIGPLVLVGAPLTLMAVAIAGAWIPARRAMRVEPAEALRYE